MSRNGSGSYTPPSNSWNPAVAGVPILADDWNQTLADLASALTTSLASDGQTTASARIPFAQGVSTFAGSTSVVAYGATGDLDTGFYFPAANQVAAVCGGTTVWTATTSGVTFPVAVTYTSITVSGAFVANGDVTLGNAAGDALTVNATGTFAGNQTFNGTATFTSTVTVPDASFSNAKLANMATQTIKGRTTAGSGAPEDLTATQATAILNPFTGDSGSGGVKGLVPAPAAGDAGRRAFLLSDGTWATAVPVGSVINHAAETAPTGWLECDGSAVSRTTYAALFAVIGTVFGTGDGSTTFNVPDLRGEFVRGWDDTRGVDPARAFGSAQADEFESHTHTVSAQQDDTPNTAIASGSGVQTATVTTSATGGTETRPRNIALLYIIKF